MPASTPSNVYQQLIKITNVYLGPAAERFIDRQIENHLKKAPSSLTQSDLIKLIDWLRLSISMLTEDKEIVEEYTSELNKLAKRAVNIKGQGK